MPSPRMEQVFYNAHSKASHYILRHTSHRFRAIIEHAILGCAICAFCTVILSHRAFVHREDIACITTTNISRDDYMYDDRMGAACGNNHNIMMEYPDDDDDDASSDNNQNLLLSGGGISIYSILVQFLRRKKYSWPSFSDKQVPLLCLKSIPGFREDADVNHILYHNDNFVEEEGSSSSSDDESSSSLVENNNGCGSRAFTVYRGSSQHDNERLVTGFVAFDHQSPRKKKQKQQSVETCVISNSVSSLQQQQHQLTLTQRLGFSSSGGQQLQQQQQQHQYSPCPEQIRTLLSHHGYLLPIIDEDTNQQQPPPLQNQVNMTTTTATTTTYSPIIYSYSHSHGLLSLTPNLQHTHNVSTQFIIPSTTDDNCFGEPFLKSIIFRLVGPDTVILNWILGLQHHYHHHHQVVVDAGSSSTTANVVSRPRFVYHWKAKKLIDLDIFDRDHYAFSSRSGGEDEAASSAPSASSSTANTTTTSSSSKSKINTLLSKLQRHPVYRLLRFLTFRLSVLLSSLFIFFLTTSLVSFTLQETQDRMLEFTLQLKDRVRNRLPLAGLIVRHVLENLVFVPIMVGMIFFLIEFYGGDKFLAFSVLSMVWLCEVFSAISIRSIQGIHFFPRVFFLYFTLFHVYFFSCPVGFTYASLASTVLFLFHTILFFWNRYELPALHAGLITPRSPRARIGPVERRGWNNNNNDSVGGTETTAPSTFLPQPYTVNQLGNPMRSAVNAASTSLQSIRSLASMQSLTSLAERRVSHSPNLIFHGGYNLNA